MMPDFTELSLVGTKKLIRLDFIIKVIQFSNEEVGRINNRITIEIV